MLQHINIYEILFIEKSPQRQVMIDKNSPKKLLSINSFHSQILLTED